jgi:hypothetical protein
MLLVRRCMLCPSRWVIPGVAAGVTGKAGGPAGSLRQPVFGPRAGARADVRAPGFGCRRDGWPGCCGQHKSNTSSGPGGVQRLVLHPADQTLPHSRTRRHRRHRPAAQQPAPPSRPRIQDSHRRPHRPSLTRHPATTRYQAPLTLGTSRNIKPKLTQPLKSLRGKLTYVLNRMSSTAAKIVGFTILFLSKARRTPNRARKLTVDP